MTESNLQYLDTPKHDRLAYRQYIGKSPGVVFLGGFHSNMRGTKATTLESWCRDNHRGFTRFDYRGHGESDGKFEDGCIGDWLYDTLNVIDACTQGPLVLVGSSMGAWLMLLVAVKRPERVAGLVGIASAADFTEMLFSQRLNAKQRDLLMTRGYIEKPSEYDESPYVYTRKLIEDGNHHLLLDKPIPIDAPVRLLHSIDDPDVPWQVSEKIMVGLRTNDVRLTLLKDAGHRLSRQEDLDLILSTLAQLLVALDNT